MEPGPEASAVYQPSSQTGRFPGRGGGACCAPVGGGGACHGFSLAVSSRQSHHQSLINPPDQVRPGVASSPPRPFPVVPPPPPPAPPSGPGPDRPRPSAPAAFFRWVSAAYFDRPLQPSFAKYGKALFPPSPLPVWSRPGSGWFCSSRVGTTGWTSPVTRHGRCFVGERITSCLINSVSSGGPFTSERRALSSRHVLKQQSIPARPGPPSEERRGAGARRLL